MLVFIDESGCTGFKLNGISSKHFIVAMVIFKDHNQAIYASHCIAKLRSMLKVKPEFKFSKSHHHVKDVFFDNIRAFDFETRALVVYKSRIQSEYLRTNARRFYNFSVAQLLDHNKHLLQNAYVKIDGRGERKFNQELKTYLTKRLTNHEIAKLKFVDSKRANLIQLADMVVGAIARHYNPNKQDSTWLDILGKGKRLIEIHEFK